ncbi:MAG: nitrate- and nitrite sensing domain-containing protein [Robiginitomaculum sp.]|nr:nitrate- and nitrite sensing domain-containing protein [Robiginitomaculum sp.]
MNKKHKDSLSTTSSTLRLLGSLAHHLQLERGCTALFLDSDGELFSTEWHEQCEKSYIVAEELKQQVSTSQSDALLDLGITKKIQGILNKTDKLSAHRESIKKFNINFARAINHYTYTLISRILDIQVEIALQLSKDETSKVTSYSNLLQWKERVGRERAWGAHGFFSDVFRNREFCERMLTMIEEQKSYQRSFLSLASEETRELLEEVTSGYSMQCVDELHKMLEQPDSLQDLEALSPITWFMLLTSKIERLKIVEDSMVNDICDGPARKHVKPLSFSAKSRQLDKYMPIIQALPAFSKLQPEELSSLLSYADIRKVEKGKLLFLQSEPLSRMYLILSGWIKLFKGTETGEEAVLQMLCAGDSIMEASVFLDIPSAASAQCVEDSILLSLPAPVVRQVLKENSAFALNMVGSLSMRSQNLIQQIEHSRLRKASERVGWFLLKLGLNESNENATCIQLPYDKSLIASYLDMTPETFSRTLKKFKDRGFRIENNTITQPDPNALCGYCDQSLANACKYRDGEDCPGTYL